MKGEEGREEEKERWRVKIGGREDGGVGGEVEGGGGRDESGTDGGGGGL